MATAVAKLSTVSTLDNTSFTHGLRGMQVSLSSFQSVALGAFAKIGSMVTGAILGLPRTLLHIGTAGLEMGSRLFEASEMLGVSTEKLATYHRAARMAGLGVSELDTMIARLNVNVGEAIAGDKKFADVLSKAGVDLRRLAQASPDEVFLQLADAISKTTSAFDRALIARQAFGRGGMQLLPLLLGGRTGIERLTASTRALGAAPGGMDAKKLDDANDAVKDLGTAFEGLKLKIARDIAPSLERAAKGLLDFLEKHNVIPRLATTVTGMGAGVAAVGIEAANLLFPGESEAFPIPTIDPAQLREMRREKQRRMLRKQGWGPRKIGAYMHDVMGPSTDLAPSPPSYNPRGREESIDIEVPGLLEVLERQQKTLERIEKNGGGMQ